MPLLVIAYNFENFISGISDLTLTEEVNPYIKKLREWTAVRLGKWIEGQLKGGGNIDVVREIFREQPPPSSTPGGQERPEGYADV